MKVCIICAKGSILSGKYNKLRGKYNPAGKYRKKPNLQYVRVPENTFKKQFLAHKGKRVFACTKCIKTLAKTK